MLKKHVVVLMGGKSSEHDVSLVSGKGVIESLDTMLYDITPVTIGRDGLWHFPDCAPGDLYDAVSRLKLMKPDCIFLALHGGPGEDGRLQGLFDLLGLPYTSSGSAASALAMDKLRSKAVVRQAGVPVAPHLELTADEWLRDPKGIEWRVQEELGFPCVLKSPCEGSSVGLAIPRDVDALPAAVAEVLPYGNVFMVEQFLAGTEVTCGVLDIEPGETPKALPVTEICPKSSAFFDYHAKYTPGACDEITPARISPEIAKLVQEYAVRAHTAVGCKVWSRSDMIITADGPVWIEVNTVPGLTPTSLFPQAAAAVGISYSRLMGMFVEAAIAYQASER